MQSAVAKGGDQDKAVQLAGSVAKVASVGTRFWDGRPVWGQRPRPFGGKIW